MPELSSEQVTVLERLRELGFEFFTNPLYERHLGVKQGNCAALLGPVEGGGFRIFGDPGYLISGNLGVRVTRNGRKYFVWKKIEIEVTLEHEDDLKRFAESLRSGLAAT
ncbi:MAG: hypothetical protein HY046_10720 [Acidobacteria bacterium]|nr:hypothetical protein [Acidobacteriota bacterium]